MKWHTELRKIRRQLRDPTGNVWAESLLRELFNQAQHDLQHATRFLENVVILSIPPRFQNSYCFDWEQEFVGAQSYKALIDQGGYLAVSGNWEIQQSFGIQADVAEPGSAYTLPWEAWTVTPYKPPVWALPDNYGSTKGIWWDQKPIEYLREKDIQSNDQAWKTISGQPYAYVMPDPVQRHLALYPIPSTIPWNDAVVDNNIQAAYSFSWESTYLPGEQWISETSTQAYVFSWEADYRGVSDDRFAHGMWRYEADFSLLGSVVINGNAAIMTARSGSVLNRDHGITLEVMEAEDNIVVIYDVQPTEIEGPGDDLDWPDYMIKYLRYRTLERAFVVQNSGENIALSELWGSRYEAGMQVIKKFVAIRRRDRDFRMRGDSVPIRRRTRHPRLPASYPA